MSTLMLEAPSPRSADQDTDKLGAFLAAFWLRPENALWMALRSDALHSAGVETFDLDLGCGDGLFTFLHHGGRLDPDFDVFQPLGDLRHRATTHSDMFNHVDESYAPDITEPALRRIRTGTDLKTALLAKACRLGLYDELIQHDHNHPLPLPSSGYETVYCNTAYWVEDIDSFLTEIRRVTAPHGRVLLHVKLDSMLRCTLERHRSALSDRFLDILDGNRFDSWPTLADRQTWEQRLTRAGFTIERTVPIASATHAHLWDVGLRPLAPLLIRMSNALDDTTRSAIKQEWVGLFLDLLEPLREPAVNLLSAGSEPVELQYELRPNATRE